VKFCSESSSEKDVKIGLHLSKLLSKVKCLVFRHGVASMQKSQMINSRLRYIVLGREVIRRRRQLKLSFAAALQRLVQLLASAVHRTWAIKRSQLNFVCNFVKNQRILMQFSVVDLEMNDTCDSINFTNLT